MRNPFDTDERSAFRAGVEKFVSNEITPYADAWDEAGEIPWDLHARVGALGVFGFGVSEKYGGLGFDDCFMRAAWNEEISRCGAGGIGAALGARSISIGPIESLASECIKRRVLKDIVTGRKGASLAITEPSGGSDVGALKTSARRDGGHYILNGSKTFITGGMTSDYFVVGARTGGSGLSGISLFFMDANTPGFSRSPMQRKMGWWSADQATLFLDDCRIPSENLLGGEGRGFIQIVRNFNYERLGIVANCLGAMKVCLDTSIAWAQERETFGKKLIRHQVIRHKIADMSARIDSIEAYLNQICWQLNDGAMPVDEICKAKFLSTKYLEYCASESMQILGGAGYLRGNSVERIYRESKALSIGGGSEEIMKNLAVDQMGL